MSRKTATMQAVADAIGVSVSTVSRVLSSPEFARDDTRYRVLKAAESLGYSRSHRRQSAQPIRFLSGSNSRETNVRNIVLMASDEMLKFIDAQADYTKQALKATTDATAAIASEGVKAMQEVAKFDLTKFYDTVSKSLKPGAKK